MRPVPCTRSAFAAALAALLCGPAAAEPALWVARDADSTVYMLGTVHVLRPETVWRTRRLEEALASSAELWLEVDLTAPSDGFLSLARFGTSPDRPLSSRLSAEDLAALKSASETVGVPLSSLEKMRPWLASVTLTLAAAKNAGLQAQGVDFTLAKEALASGKPIQGFETAEEQLRFFGDLSEEAELALLRQTIGDIARGPRVIADLLRAWSAGDVDMLSALVLDELAETGDEVYGALIVDRNRAMAERIAKTMSGSGTHFVAVGAAHLLGPDSIQRFLKEKGVASERVE